MTACSTPTSLPEMTAKEYIRLRRDLGWSRQQIADRYGKTRAWVSWKVQQLGIDERTPRQKAVTEFWPWKTVGDASRARVAKSLRAAMVYHATGGRGMRPDDLTRLVSFIQMLRDRNYVVRFDPDIPSQPGMASGGWEFVTRKPSDGDLMVRLFKPGKSWDENAPTDTHVVVDVDRKIIRAWEFPKSLPDYKRV